MSAYVGQQLRQARQTKNLTLEQISRVTYIRVSYLEALESGQLERLPSPAQARGFLRTYAKHLGLTPEPLLAALDRNDLVPHSEDIPTPEPQAPTPVSEAVFVEIGQALRQHRELLGLKLEDIEQQTRIRLHYLQALEAGNLEALPSPVQGRGMLNNYATFLGLDTDPLLLKFADGLQARLMARRGARASTSTTNPREQTSPPRGPQKSPIRRFISNDLIFGSILGVGLLVFVIWGAIRVSTLTTAEQASPTAPSIVDMLAPEMTPSPITTLSTPGGESPVETSGEITPTPGLSIPIFSEDAVQLYIIARQRAWMRITVDGEVAFEGRVIPGNAYSYSGQDTIDLLTGNGAALQVYFNQNDLGPIGLFGEVIQRTFTPLGVVLPTPTVTPTPTITETPAFVETPTETPTPTPPP
ncbi:MAG: DUF4115 domain-containing protein [Anaerolineales bacterium]|nr:DUF4115 domain-containing protein [Anaerolineales bacterium]